MVIGYLGGLISAWFLGLFGLHDVLIELAQPFISMDLTKSHYYVAMGVIGMIGGAFTRVVRVNTD